MKKKKVIIIIMKTRSKKCHCFNLSFLPITSLDSWLFPFYSSIRKEKKKKKEEEGGGGGGEGEEGECLDPKERIFPSRPPLPPYTHTHKHSHVILFGEQIIEIGRWIDAWSTCTPLTLFHVSFSPIKPFFFFFSFSFLLSTRKDEKKKRKEYMAGAWKGCISWCKKMLSIRKVVEVGFIQLGHSLTIIRTAPDHTRGHRDVNTTLGGDTAKIR